MDQKKRLSAKEIVANMRNGLDDDALMTKFGLSRKQLEAVFKKLLGAGHISQADLDARVRDAEDLLDVEPDVPSPIEPQSGFTQSAAVDGEDSPAPVISPSLSRTYASRAALGIISGILIQVAGAVIIRQKVLPGPVGGLIALGGTALLLWGCYNLVMKKGYHWALSLLGIPWCFGLLFLLLIPDKHKAGSSWKPTIVALVVLGAFCFMSLFIVPIFLAISIPYYVSYKRTSCDRMAIRDVALFGAAMERLGKEAGKASLPWNEESAGKLASKNAMGYLVGPYYGWAGSSKKCSVLVRMTKEKEHWVFEGVALKGSHPGPRSRYVYRRRIIGDKYLRSKVVSNVTDARDGQTQHWNSYPAHDKCYTSSLLQKIGDTDDALFAVGAPRKSEQCSKILRRK
jgi:hypothetical protein